MKCHVFSVGSDLIKSVTLPAEFEQGSESMRSKFQVFNRAVLQISDGNCILYEEAISQPSVKTFDRENDFHPTGGVASHCGSRRLHTVFLFRGEVASCADCIIHL